MDSYSTAFTLPRSANAAAAASNLAPTSSSAAAFNSTPADASAGGGAAAADDNAASSSAGGGAAAAGNTRNNSNNDGAEPRSGTSPAPVQSFSNLVAQHQRHLASSLGRFGSMRSRFPPSIKGFTSAFSSGGFSKRAATERIVEAASKTEAEAEAEAERDKDKDGADKAQQSDAEDGLRSITPGPAASAKRGFTASFKKHTSSSNTNNNNSAAAQDKQQQQQQLTVAGLTPTHAVSGSSAPRAPPSVISSGALSDIDAGAETETEDLQSNAGTTVSLASSSKLGSTTTSITTASGAVPFLDNNASASTAAGAGPNALWSSNTHLKQLPLLPPPLQHSGAAGFGSDGLTIPRGAATSPVSNEVVQEAANLEQALKAAQAAAAAGGNGNTNGGGTFEPVSSSSGGSNLLLSTTGSAQPSIVSTLENATTVHPRARTASAGGSIFNGLAPSTPGVTGVTGPGSTYGITMPVGFPLTGASAAARGSVDRGPPQPQPLPQTAHQPQQQQQQQQTAEDMTEAVARLAQEVMARHGCVVSYTAVYDEGVAVAPSAGTGTAGADMITANSNGGANGLGDGTGGAIRPMASSSSMRAGAGSSGPIAPPFPRHGSFSAASSNPYGSGPAPGGGGGLFASSTHSLPFPNSTTSNAFASAAGTGTGTGATAPSHPPLLQAASSTGIPLLDSHLLLAQQQQHLQQAQQQHQHLNQLQRSLRHSVSSLSQQAFAPPPPATPGSTTSGTNTWANTSGIYPSEVSSSASSFIERAPGGGGGGPQTPGLFGETTQAALYSQLYGTTSNNNGTSNATKTSAAAVAAALSAHNLALGMQSTTSLASHHYPHSMHEVPYSSVHHHGGAVTMPPTPAAVGSGAGGSYLFGAGGGGGGAGGQQQQQPWGSSSVQLQQQAQSQSGAGGKARGSLPMPNMSSLSLNLPSTSTGPFSSQHQQPPTPAAAAAAQQQQQQPAPIPVPTRFNFHISGTFAQVMAARGSLMREQPFKNRAVIRVPRVDVLVEPLLSASSSSAPGGGGGGGSGSSGPNSGSGSRAGSPPTDPATVAAGGSSSTTAAAAGLELLKPHVRQRLEAIASATTASVRVGKTDSHGMDLGYGLESGRVVELIVEGSFESVEQGRVGVLVLLDELSGLHVEEVEIDYKVHNIVGGRKRCHIQTIEEETATNIYLPTPFAGVMDASSVLHPSVKARQNTVYITGEFFGVKRAKEILYQAAVAKSTSIISRTTPVSPRKVDWMLLERLDELRSIMSDNATFVNLPPMGSQTNMLSVYGDSRVNIERTTRSIMTLTAQFYVASVWLLTPTSNAYEAYHLNNSNSDSSLSAEQVNPILTHVSNASGAEVVFKKNAFELHGLENEVRKAVSQILELDLVKSYNAEIRFQIELANEQREFISGKKNGKTNKIMKQCGVRIKFEPFNDYNFFIDLSGNDKVSALQGLSLLQEELPAEISFHVPESYHKRIIGVGGKNIQRIMKKYGVYVKFSNAEEFAALGGYIENEDNVIARTPAKNAINLENLKQSVMELVNEKDREYVLETVVIARRYHRTLLGEKAIFIHDIEQKTGSIIRFPAPERASDIITLFGPESQIHIAAQMLLDHVPFEAEFRTPASPELVRLLSSQEFGALVERVARDLHIHIVPLVPPGVGQQQGQGQQQRQQQQQAEAVFKLRLNRSNVDFLPSAKDLIEDFLISRNMQIFPTPSRARSDSFASSLPHFATKLLSPAASMSPAAASLGILGPTESNDSLNLELARYNERRLLRAAASTPDIKALFGPYHASVASLGSFGHHHHHQQQGMSGGGHGLGFGSASASMHAAVGGGGGHSGSYFNTSGSSHNLAAAAAAAAAAGGSASASLHSHGHPSAHGTHSLGHAHSLGHGGQGQHGGHARAQLYSGDYALGHLHGAGGSGSSRSVAAGAGAGGSGTYRTSQAHGASSPLVQSSLYSSPYGHAQAGFNQSDIWGAPRHLPNKSTASLQYPQHASRFSDDAQSLQHKYPHHASRFSDDAQALMNATSDRVFRLPDGTQTQPIGWPPY